MRPSSPFPQSVAGAPFDEREPFDESEKRLRYNQPRGHPNGVGRKVGTAGDKRLTQLCARSYGTDQFDATVVAAQLDLLGQHKKIRRGKTSKRPKGHAMPQRNFNAMLKTRNLVHPLK